MATSNISIPIHSSRPLSNGCLMVRKAYHLNQHIILIDLHNIVNPR